MATLPARDCQVSTGMREKRVSHLNFVSLQAIFCTNVNVFSTEHYRALSFCELPHLYGSCWKLRWSGVGYHSVTYVATDFLMYMCTHRGTSYIYIYTRLHVYIHIHTHVPLYAHMYFCTRKEACMAIPIEISTPGLIKMYWNILSLQAWISITWNSIFIYSVLQLKMMHEIIVH